MLDWLIVGGGIHGTHHSFYLTRLGGFAPERVRVLDPHPKPLALWQRYTRNTGMTYLRSPHVHSLDRDPLSISTFAKTRAGQGLADFIPTHSRPSLALFHAHSEWMIEKHGLAKMRVQGRARGLERINGGWRVETDDGGIEAKRVIVAIGATEQPHWPQWAVETRRAGGHIQHIFDADFASEQMPISGRFAVIGGGISAAQFSLWLAQRIPGQVTLLMRHPPRVFPFDSDLCWLNAACLNDFHKLTSYEARREAIRKARHRGSMPQEVYHALREASTTGAIKLCITEVVDASVSELGTTLTVSSGETLTVNRVILATGYETQRPGDDWLSPAVEAYGLMTAPCGYPIVQRSLEWAKWLYVSGPLAELEIGPVSRNIIGARLAAERIAAN